MVSDWRGVVYSSYIHLRISCTGESTLHVLSLCTDACSIRFPESASEVWHAVLYHIHVDVDANLHQYKSSTLC